MPTHKVLVVADDPLVRGGLSRILVDNNDLVVSGQVSGKEFSISLLEIYQPDAVLWDLGWDPGSSVDALLDLPELGIPIILLAPDGMEEYSVFTENVGGMLSRDVRAEQVRAAVLAAVDGLVVFDRTRAKKITRRSTGPLEPLLEDLTHRELEVLRLLAEGLPNKQIALGLGISDHPVKFPITSILNKLNAQSRTEAVVRATRLGLITL